MIAIGTVLLSLPAATADGTIPPRSISYVKEPSGFYRALAFNAEPDHAPE